MNDKKPRPKSIRSTVGDFFVGRHFYIAYGNEIWIFNLLLYNSIRLSISRCLSQRIQNKKQKKVKHVRVVWISNRKQ